MSSFFDIAIAWIRSVEGGYFADPRGGATYAGVRQDLFNDWMLKRGGRPIPVMALANQPELLEAYYLMEYFLPAKMYDLLPYEGPALVMMDGAVQHGVSKMTKLFQLAIGAAVDGDFGSHTLAQYRTQIREQGADSLITTLISQRHAYYLQIGDARFQQGWENRLAQLAEKCKALSA